MHKKKDQNNIIVNNIFVFQVTLDIIQNDEDPKPQNVKECQKRNDLSKWKEAIYVSRIAFINKMRSFMNCSPNGRKCKSC